jgi:hypothetical protein
MTKAMEMAMSAETISKSPQTRGGTNAHVGMELVAVDIRFLPLKAFAGSAELSVTMKNGLGRWRIPVILKAELGAVDGLLLPLYQLFQIIIFFPH